MKSIILSLIATQAIASDCYPRTDLIALLADNYGEAQMIRAMEDRGGMMEVYVSPSGGWTMVVVPPVTGEIHACIVATGTNWMMVPQGELN